MNFTTPFWYIVKKDKEYYAETIYISKISGKEETHLFRDWNHEIMSLSTDKNYAKFWCNSRNIIERIF